MSLSEDKLAPDSSTEAKMSTATHRINENGNRHRKGTTSHGNVHDQAAVGREDGGAEEVGVPREWEAEGAEVPSDAAVAAGVRAGRRTGTTSDFRFH